MGLSSDTSIPRKRSKKSKDTQDSEPHAVNNLNVDPLLAESETTLAIAAEGANSKSSKKKKTRKSDQVVVLETTDTLDDRAPEPDMEPLQTETSNAEQHPELTEVSRRQKRSSVIEVDDILGSHLHNAPNAKISKKKKKKRTKVDADQDIDPPSADAPTSKKRKTSPSEELDKSAKPGKDKKRKPSKYPDPFEDAELPENSQKALNYARTFVVDQPSWKFNKASQNWLVRNIWSGAMIPEKYYPAVKKYLKTIQGGARIALVAKCREVITSATNTEGASQTEKDTDHAEGTTTTSNTARAQGILTALGEPLE